MEKSTDIQPIVELTNLEFQYDRGGFHIKLPHLVIHRGQKVAMIGASGMGKTTLLQLIAGIQRPLAGQIQVVDVSMHQLSDAARRQFRISHIGFVFQDFELVEFLNVFDNILHAYRLNPALKLDGVVKARAHDLATQLGIVDKLKRSIKALSQGERQRVAICRALLPQPQLILADEAMGNLDPDNKQRILDILFRYVDEQPATLLAVTHDYELLECFDRVVDLKSATSAQSEPTQPVVSPLTQKRQEETV